MRPEQCWALASQMRRETGSGELWNPPASSSSARTAAGPGRAVTKAASEEELEFSLRGWLAHYRDARTQKCCRSKDRPPASTCATVGQKSAHVYFKDEPGRRGAAKLLTRDDAHRIALDFATLPDLLRK